MVKRETEITDNNELGAFKTQKLDEALLEYKNAEWAKRESEITDNNELGAFKTQKLDDAL